MGVIFRAGGSVCDNVGSSLRTPLTTFSVDALPDFRTTASTPRCPSWRTILVCGMLPSAMVATSRT